jgi:precorrin-4 C11-methyltransferase
MGKVFFIGAGPGDPELITVKGQKRIAAADVVLYAGSLVAPEILQSAAPEAELHNSAGMKLEQQVTLMVEAARQGKQIARLHTGDPSIYGAIDEQIRALDEAGVPYEVIPGVSSAFAAAAALGLEYTLPGITQTLILTRANGRTPVPELENLRSLAAHHSSMAIFLSTGLIVSVVEDLLAAGYTPETPIALVYRASWPDQKVVRGTLANIAARLDREELTHQGLIVVGPALRSERELPSHLYGDFQNRAPTRSGTAILALTAPAVDLGRRILKDLPDARLYLPERYINEGDRACPSVIPFRAAIRQVLHDAFQRHEALVCILASGIVVRELAPLLRNKHSDPAVVVLDPSGKYAVSLLSGHEGGANRLAERIAALTGGQAVITTASDNRQIPALDVLAKQRSWKADPNNRLARVMTALVDGEPVGLIRDETLVLPPEMTDFAWDGVFSTEEAGVAGFPRRQQGVVWVTCRAVPASFWQENPDAVVYYPPALALGIGCNRGTSGDEILDAVHETLARSGLAAESVAGVATITEKGDEPGLIGLCRAMGWKLEVFSHTQIRQVENIPNPSKTVYDVLGVPGVAEPAALLAAGASRLLVEKQKFANVTVAVAMKGTQ